MSILFSEIDFQFQTYSIGLERNIRGAWELGMERFHCLSRELSPTTIEAIDEINTNLGVNTIQINLTEFRSSYRTSDEISHALQEDNSARWIWFTDAEVLKDTNYAGWLRSLLTTRDIQNLRVVFIIRTKTDYFEVFQNNQAPLYRSTLPLHFLIR